MKVDNFVEKVTRQQGFEFWKNASKDYVLLHKTAFFWAFCILNPFHALPCTWVLCFSEPKSPLKKGVESLNCTKSTENCKVDKTDPFILISSIDTGTKNPTIFECRSLAPTIFILYQRSLSRIKAVMFCFIWYSSKVA